MEPVCAPKGAWAGGSFVWWVSQCLRSEGQQRFYSALKDLFVGAIL